MKKVHNFFEEIKHKSEQEKHDFAIFISFVATLAVVFFILLSWYLYFFDIKIENTLLTNIVSFFE